MAERDEDEAFEIEMSAHPWGYGQQHKEDFEFALAKVRQHGLWEEAAVIAREVQALRAELEALRGSRG